MHTEDMTNRKTSKIPGYGQNRHDREIGKSGCVCIFIKENLNYLEEGKKLNIEYNAIEIPIQNSSQAT